MKAVNERCCPCVHSPWWRKVTTGQQMAVKQWKPLTNDAVRACNTHHDDARGPPVHTVTGQQMAVKQWKPLTNDAVRACIHSPWWRKVTAKQWKPLTTDAVRACIYSPWWRKMTAKQWKPLTNNAVRACIHSPWWRKVTTGPRSHWTAEAEVSLGWFRLTADWLRDWSVRDGVRSTLPGFQTHPSIWSSRAL